MSRAKPVDRVVLVVTGGAVLLVLATAVLVATPLRSWFHRSPVAYQRGDRIDLPATLYEAGEFTTFLFARSDCGVCQETKTVYAQVIAELRSSGSTKVVLVGRASHHDEDAVYAAALGLEVTEYAPAEFGRLRLRHVPTLVVVDRTGTIIGAWEGAPPRSERHDFGARVKSVLRR
jgi:hypothetical protein